MFSTRSPVRGIAAAAIVVSLASGAFAQAYPSPQDNSRQSGYGQPGYDPQQDYSPQRGGPPGRDYPAPDAGQNARGDQGYGRGDPGYGAPPPGYDSQAPSGYDGSRPPPPPPGYQADQAYAPSPDADRRYEAYAEDWAQRYCSRAPNNAGAGAVIGGLFGALLGSGVAGRGNHGEGAVLGGVAGAAGGAVVGSTSRNDTSPGCPPGFVVRGGAPAFAYGGYGGSPYLYAAPAWYRPWTFYGGRWAYRPYPYHVFYYQRFGYGRGFYGRSHGYGRPYGYRRGYGYRRPYGWRPR